MCVSANRRRPVAVVEIGKRNVFVCIAMVGVALFCSIDERGTGPSSVNPVVKIVKDSLKIVYKTADTVKVPIHSATFTLFDSLSICIEHDNEIIPPGSVTIVSDSLCEFSFVCDTACVVHVNVGGMVSGKKIAVDTASIRIVDPVKILCLGNSITEGTADFPGYRYFLSKQLQKNDCYFDFIGTRNGVFCLDSLNDYQGAPDTLYNECSDWDHEARFAWTSSDVVNGACLAPWRDEWQGRTQCDNYPDEKLEKWLDQLAEQGDIPDVALIHLGTNDMLFGISRKTILQNYHSIVSMLRVKNPRIYVFFAYLIPRADHEHLNDTTTVFNLSMKTYIMTLSTDSSKVVAVDMNTHFNRMEWLYDGLHPDNDGAAFMANKWYDYLTAMDIFSYVQ